jgi:hypothetical protein
MDKSLAADVGAYTEELDPDTRLQVESLVEEYEMTRRL